VLFLLLWICFIWSNSLQSAESSDASSDSVVHLVEPVLTAAGVPAEDHSFLVRKGAHFTEFAVLGVLCCLCFVGPPRWKKLMYALAVCAAVAAADEGIQIFSEGRSSSLRDVGIDILGVSCGITVSEMSACLRKKRAFAHRSAATGEE